MNCEQLQQRLKELQERKLDLEKTLFSMGSYMGGIADNASMDDSYSRLSDRQDEIEDELEVLEGEIEELQESMREQNCPPNE